MAREPQPKQPETPLAAMLRARAKKVEFALWIIGDTPLISHAWSQKAKLEMLSKQTKSVSVTREARSPKDDFNNSLYRTDDGHYCFPAMAFKDAIVSVAHKDKGIAKTDVQRALFLEAKLIRTYTAHEDAICDMPVVRIYGSEPEMREDNGGIGAGVKKTATLIYRAQFTTWAVRLTGELRLNVIPLEALQFLIDEAGSTCGVGDWRIEKSGMFGSFHLASDDEARAWDGFAAGRAPLPVREKELV